MEQTALKGKTAVVTGSPAAIGAAVAPGLACRGADIVINYCKSGKQTRSTP